ncbi:serine protease [Pseudoalteromonas sp. CO348]|uniref:trypsin-like peptidase domain-containing protein n=1 Tax=Pseudoalteromonas TaxID=53246 RepID=UPI001023747C|nr:MULTISPECIES: trypsin-like peptidase domain-containing protein [Pseudoalteromonas]MCG7539519.1 trypsin-like peptidase domain-containing protein [Pseudoalteromonas sp. OF7H-1]MCG9771554.1 trypsin-like peptidase domain-containing protein [Pseudoalteromonas piscicida]RZG05623.1 serine protease [Pseudoalteromonas sp. CO348]
MGNKKNVEMLDRVVRIIDKEKRFLGTGLLLNENGWVLTCGHLFKDLSIQDGISLNKKLDLEIQTFDNNVYECDYLEEKFYDAQNLFDYAIIKTKCSHKCKTKLNVRRKIEENTKAHMHGFSGNADFLLRINGTIIGPTYSYSTCSDLPALQLQWDSNGTYSGFSGSPILVKDSRLGLFLAGVQNSELNKLDMQFGTPLINILDHSSILTDTVEGVSDMEYRKAGFKLEYLVELNTSEPSESDINFEGLMAEIKQHTPKLVGQISEKKLLNRLIKKVSKKKHIVGFVVCHQRPNKNTVRRSLAKHFGRNKWTQNMYDVVTEEELVQLRKYLEYVQVLLFKGIEK